MAGCGRCVVLPLVAACFLPNGSGLADCRILVRCLDPLHSVVLLALVALGSTVAHNGWPCVGGYRLSTDSFVSLGITTANLHFFPLKRCGEPNPSHNRQRRRPIHQILGAPRRLVSSASRHWMAGNLGNHEGKPGRAAIDSHISMRCTNSYSLGDEA